MKGESQNMPLFNVKNAVDGRKTARNAKKGQSAQPTPFEVLAAKYENLQAQHQATLDENTRLHSKVRDLEKEKARVPDDTAEGKPRVMAGQKPCSECQVSYPDSLAFFGDGDGNLPDQCAACARATLHDSGVPHYPAGCPRCATGGQ